jgi:hypothetical protein
MSRRDILYGKSDRMDIACGQHQHAQTLTATPTAFESLAAIRRLGKEEDSLLFREN